MATLKITGCSGEIPRIAARLLPNTAAQYAENVRLEDGSLDPIRQAALVHTFADLGAPIQTIYKHLGTWLAWDSVVHAAPGPVAQNRLYYTGDGAPKMRVSGTVYPLALDAPVGALTATMSGSATSSEITTRLYVYTWVTQFDEESEPSPISAPIDWQPGKNVTLSGFQSTPAGRGINRQRIYRSQSSSSSGTELFFITERAASAASMPDLVAVDDFGEVIPSSDYNTPPSTMRGLTAFVAGMMVAFDGKDLCVSEPYKPHAWPIKYRLSMDYDIVALGVYGSTVVVMTEGFPYIVQGGAPETLQQDKAEVNFPCINARGVVDLGYGIAYPSHDGLVIASAGGFNIVSASVFTRDGWGKVNPAGFVAGQYNGRYFFSYQFVQDGADTIQGTYILDVSGQTPFLLRASRYAEAMYYDVTQSALYMVNGLGVYQWDAPGVNLESMRWKSKPFVLEAPSAYGVLFAEGHALTPDEQAELDATQAAIQEHNDAVYAIGALLGSMDSVEADLWPINGDALGNALPTLATTIKVYADHVLVATVTTVNEPVRLPAIPRARIWEVEVLGTKQIEQIVMATKPQELNLIG